MKNFYILFILLGSWYAALGQDRSSLTICWDSSISMDTGIADNNIGILQNYFEEHPNIDVNLLVFSNTIQLKESYTISNGVWSDLLATLSTIIYDGGTSYASLMTEDIKSDEVLVFTDGIENLSDTDFSFDSLTTIYCGSTDCIKRLLKKSGPLTKMINTRFNSQKRTDTISNLSLVSGYLQNSFGPVVGAEVLNVSNNERVKTSSDGSYTLKARKKDTLQFTYVGANPFKKKVTEIGRILTLDIDEDNLLNEVVLEGKASYDDDSSILVGDRTVDKKELGYDVRTLDTDEIASNNVNLGTAIKGKVAGVQVGYYNDISATIIRGYNTIKGNSHPLLVIDGVPLPRSNLRQVGNQISGGGVLDVIDPNNVKSISVLKGLAATNRYGSEGNSGVILITTKTGSSSKIEGDVKKVLGTTKTYDSAAAIVIADFNDPLFSSFEGVKDVATAYDIYLEERENRRDDFSFYLAAARYFKGYNNDILTQRVLSNSLEVAGSNIGALKAISYVYEDLGFVEEAIRVQEKILEETTNNVQTIRNLAFLHEKNNEVEKSFDYFLKAQKLILEKPRNVVGLEENITTEFKSFVARNRSKLDLKKVQPQYEKSTTIFKRVVFEWNNYDAQFNIQIVNPQNRYFTWSHSQESEAVRLRKEQEQGYGLEEYFLTPTDKGEWLFNLERLGSAMETSVPLYFKISVYSNFGQVNESVVTKVVKISEPNKSTTVLKLNI